MTVHRPSAEVDAIGDGDPGDRCRFQSAFELEWVPCAAFQSLPFTAATSYGKPLSTHVACAHLQAGESARNQFYPRCGLGGDRDRLRWVAGVGPGTVEVMRSLQADFEAVASRYRPRLVAAKANLLSQPPPARTAARNALAVLTREFIAAIEDFVNLHASRIAHTGTSPASLNRIAADALLEWQGNRRLDLPGIDEHWRGRQAPEAESAAADVAEVAGLRIATLAQPPTAWLTGHVDQANLSTLAAALGAAMLMGTPLRVDVSGLTFCSVAGMRYLMAAADSGEVALVGVPAHMARAFDAAEFAAAGTA